jgi:hypothetical protein
MVEKLKGQLAFTLKDVLVIITMVASLVAHYFMMTSRQTTQAEAIRVMTIAQAKIEQSVSEIKESQTTMKVEMARLGTKLEEHMRQ